MQSAITGSLLLSYRRTIVSEDTDPSTIALIIHERFYCNHRYAAATGLAAGFPHPSGQARRSVGRHTVSSMPSFLAAPRARLAWRLGSFVTNRHE
jgi:hypothetical protein